jgi:hypothetical protein
VDWELDREIFLEKQKMERDISHTLLASRITELKVPLAENVSNVRTYLLPFHDLLSFHVTTHRSLVSVQKQCELLNAEMQSLSTVTTEHEGVLYQLAQLYGDMSQLQAQRAAIAGSISKNCVGIDTWHEQHVAAAQTIRGRRIATIREEFVQSGQTQLSDSSAAAGAHDFLVTAGQGQLLEECEHFERDVVRSAGQYRERMMQCITQLLEYQSIAAEYPRELVYRNRCYVWKSWREELLGNPTANACNRFLTSAVYVSHAWPGRVRVHVALCRRVFTASMPVS